MTDFLPPATTPAIPAIPTRPARPVRPAREIRRLATALIAAGATVAGAVSVSAPAPAGAYAVVPAAGTQRVFVAVAPGAETSTARALIEVAGGRVLRELPLDGTFVAELPVATVPLFRSQHPWMTATYDCVRPLSLFGDMVLNPDRPVPDSDAGRYTLSSIATAMGAGAFTDRGYDGRGIDVAIVDTGVAPVGPFTPGTTALVHGPDLSYDAPVAALRHLDAFGHGTHMAGIVNAVAPGARVVSLKVGDMSGAVDVTQVIAAIDWVREHRRAYGLNIRVLNLSFGIESANHWTTDELSLAVDAAWRAGIVVVVSGGNGGRAAAKTDPGLLAPAYNRNVLAVGAYDSRHPGTRADDTVAGFTSGASSSNKRAPDVVAPGRSVESLRVPGSAADEQVTERLCAIDAAEPLPVSHDGRFVRGSGSSQAAAAASGAVALLLSQRPDLTPDMVKAMLRDHATRVMSFGRPAGKELAGEGAIDLDRLVGAAAPRRSAQHNDAVVGGGSLDATRFGELLRRGEQPADPGVPVGEVDVFGRPFRAGDHARRLATGAPTWTDTPAGQAWMGLVVTGPAPDGGRLGGEVSRWPGFRWREASWSGLRWRDEAWSAMRWRGDGWSGLRWRDHGWSGMRWRDAAWSDSDWR